MLLQTILLASESYTFNNWEFRDIFVGFSRLYYVIDGEGYYREDGRVIRLKRNHLYLTPVKKHFDLFDNPNDKLLHTYCHVVTIPPVDHLIEAQVSEGTPLADAVALWRKYIFTQDKKLLSDVTQFLLSCMGDNAPLEAEAPIAKHVRDYIDTHADIPFHMTGLCHALNYTREHITRSFLNAYHMTPRQYDHQIRMNDALRRLLNGQSVSEVAAALFYANPYAFSKAFKKHFGLSPQKYLAVLRTEQYRPAPEDKSEPPREPSTDVTHQFV